MSRLSSASVFAAVFVFSFISCSVQALPTSGNLYISIPNSTVKCANIVLPDDGGYFGLGSVDYVLTMTPDPRDTWSDLSYQRVTTDENNTVIIPVCFSSVGRQLGNCSEPFTIHISAPAVGVDRVWHGGVCASRYPDFDTSDRGSVRPPSDSMAGLDDVDIFTLGFQERKKYATPGQVIEFVLYKFDLEERTLEEVMEKHEHENAELVEQLYDAL